LDFSLCKRIIENISRVIVGKNQSIELLLVALLADGHVLIEDLPGLGKTLLAKSLARSIGGSFRRVQFTPDLLPADITGFNVYNQRTGQFAFQLGPVMTNILLADEINRTIPRTQSSLLESMEERQVTSMVRPILCPTLSLSWPPRIQLNWKGPFLCLRHSLTDFSSNTLGYPAKAEEIAILERFREKDPLIELEGYCKS